MTKKRNIMSTKHKIPHMVTKYGIPILIAIGIVSFVLWIVYCGMFVCEGMHNVFQHIFYNGFFTALALIVNTILAIYGLSRYFDQEKKEDKQSTSKFLSSMNISYTENKDFTEIYRALDVIYYFEKWQSEGGGCLFDTDQYKKAVRYLMTMTADNFSVISNYLSFFEVFTILLRNRSISFKDMNDLFYYRFFLAVQCGIIRNKTIYGIRKEYFHNIENLRRKWTQWRRRPKKQRENLEIYANKFSEEFIREIFEMGNEKKDPAYVEKMIRLFRC